MVLWTGEPPFPKGGGKRAVRIRPGRERAVRTQRRSHQGVAPYGETGEAHVGEGTHLARPAARQGRAVPKGLRGEAELWTG